MSETSEHELFNKYEESIKSLKNIIEYWAYKPSEVFAAKTAISALEKQMPKRVQDKTIVYTSSLEGTCGACGYDDISTVYGHRYCPYCGQRLDWGNVYEIQDLQ